MPLAFSDMAAHLVFSAAAVGVGCYFFSGAFRREIRQRRADPEDARPVMRSDRADRLVQIACFCLGTMGLITGLLLAYAALAV